jgi:hypothetical protein
MKLTTDTANSNQNDAIDIIPLTQSFHHCQLDYFIAAERAQLDPS